MNDTKKTFRHLAVLLLTSISLPGMAIAQKLTFDRDFSPAEHLVKPQEKPFRQDICLNGSWDFQPVPLPSDWKSGNGTAPELPPPAADKWETVKIKIPSPWNVNDWGGGSRTGAGTSLPYAPGSVYFPSYPESWIHPRMGWLKREFTVPEEWSGKRLVLHFEAVAGECVIVINGKEVCRHFDQHLPFDADVTAFVNPAGKNELLVGVRHGKLFEKTHPVYKMMRAVYAPGSNTSDLAGIWQDVFLTAVPEVHVADVFVQPWVDRDELIVETTIVNRSKKKQSVTIGGDIREWINKAGKDVLTAPEIDWELGNTVLSISDEKIVLEPEEEKTITLKTRVNGRLEKWSPDRPNLYCLLTEINGKKQTVDRKNTRFGWRQFTIEGTEFKLNGEKIQCFGDIQHPFGPYICSRRFAWAWLTMIKDFGGNAVRPHAQPWPKIYYELADELGLLVLDETGLFGSSIELNFEDETAWKNYGRHVDRLVLRDRNHPSVIGWSVGNEIFAIALLNKAPEEAAKKWETRMYELSQRVPRFDPTRAFITVDGDRDLDGRMPVWSKHFAHGMQLDMLPEQPDKPLVVGESGATYYGRPEQLYPFAGDKAYESYYGRNEALATDIYQNVVRMAKPMLAYYSPSEVCWFGIEHLNIGYHDYSRLPGPEDGVFAGKPYEENKPGYQFERIPPYVSTFNPGLDPDLPLYKPLPMFLALKAALAGEPCPWDRYTEHKRPALPEPAAAVYPEVRFIGDTSGMLADRLKTIGIRLSGPPDCNAVIVDGEYLPPEQATSAARLFEETGKTHKRIIVMVADKGLDPGLASMFPAEVTLTDRQSSAFEPNRNTEWGRYFSVPDCYFAEIESKEPIMKQGIAGAFAEKGQIILQASGIDWQLFNQAPENRKCAQVVLYEKLHKPSGATLVSLQTGKSDLILSTVNYKIDTKETRAFWERLFAVAGIASGNDSGRLVEKNIREHDLLMDGPVNQ